MTSNAWLLLLAFGLLGCSTVSTPQYTGRLVDAMANNSRYFSQTGHTIRPPFLAYYLTHDGLAQFGYPITEALDQDGWQVQYFQFVRLEQHPENHPDYFITVGWLGQLSHRTQPPIYKPRPQYGRYFPASGHTVQGDFLTFFSKNGGPVRFGLPISEPFIHQDRLTQDFQSARLFWQPDAASPVLLEPLGETYFLSSDLPLSLLDPLQQPPKASLFEPEIITGTDGITTRLWVESTPRNQVIRVWAEIFRYGQPQESYAADLVIAGQRRQLPPTRASGKTHTLVDISNIAQGEFSLYPLGGQDELATVNYP